MSEIKVDCRMETCPVPLVETRKAIRKALPGDVIEVVGTHPASKKEIPMALNSMGLKILESSEEAGVWKIKFKV